MRFRPSLVAFACVLVPLSAMAVIQACGGNTDDTATDAAKDSTTKDQVNTDVAPDVAPEAGCTNDADLTQLIPDGGIDADAGSFPISACFGCFESKCSAQVNACNADCSCRQTVLTAISCIEMTGDFMTCGFQALTTGDSNVTDLFGCAENKCLATCTGDGGVTISDAASDGD